MQCIEKQNFYHERNFRTKIASFGSEIRLLRERYRFSHYLIKTILSGGSGNMAIRASNNRPLDML